MYLPLMLNVIHRCFILRRNRLTKLSMNLSRLVKLQELILQENNKLTISAATLCSITQLAVLDVRGCEPAVLDGSLHRILRHVPEFLFTTLQSGECWQPCIPSSC